MAKKKTQKAKPQKAAKKTKKACSNLCKFSRLRSKIWKNTKYFTNYTDTAQYASYLYKQNKNFKINLEFIKKSFTPYTEYLQQQQAKIIRPDKLQYQGKLLRPELAQAIKDLWKDLVKVGCFYTYNDVIEMSFKHVRYYIFYLHYPEEVYPCDKKFNLMARKYFVIDTDPYYHNDGLDVVEDFWDKNKANAQLYFQNLKGVLEKYDVYGEYHERISDEYCIFWNAAERYVDETGMQSPYIDLTVGFENLTGIILINFNKGNVSKEISVRTPRLMEIIEEEYDKFKAGKYS